MLHDAIDRASDLTQLWWDCTQIATDVPYIITMRVMGLSGVWTVSDNEKKDMFREKAPILTEAIISGTLAAWSGHAPDRIMQATIDPISRKTKDNRARLANAGPRIPVPPLGLTVAAGSN